LHPKIVSIRYEIPFIEELLIFSRFITDKTEEKNRARVRIHARAAKYDETDAKQSSQTN